jgi:hypothetical protein
VNLPDSARKTRDELTASEKIAIVHLGLYAYENYAKAFGRAVAEFSDYTY